jgi:hypothetical protein
MQKSWKAAAKAANRHTLLNKLFDLGTILKHMNFPLLKERVGVSDDPGFGVAPPGKEEQTGAQILGDAWILARFQTLVFGNVALCAENTRSSVQQNLQGCQIKKMALRK